MSVRGFINIDQYSYNKGKKTASLCYPGMCGSMQSTISWAHRYGKTDIDFVNKCTTPVGLASNLDLFDQAYQFSFAQILQSIINIHSPYYMVNDGISQVNNYRRTPP